METGDLELEILTKHDSVLCRGGVDTACLQCTKLETQSRYNGPRHPAHPALLPVHHGSIIAREIGAKTLLHSKTGLPSARQ